MSEEKNFEHCGNCKFFTVFRKDDEWDREIVGCLRYPPSIDGEFPATNRLAWCGEYKKQKEK